MQFHRFTNRRRPTDRGSSRRRGAKLGPGRRAASVEHLEPRHLLTAIPECIDFDSLAVGTELKVGASLMADNVGFRAEIFGEPYQTTSSGFARVDNAGSAGGSLNDLNVNNILLNFKFDAVLPLPGLKFNFGEYGGNLNLEINGDLVSFENFADVHNTFIGGTFVTVPTGGSGQDQGVVVIDGPVHEFKIGGQELWIDNVCMDEEFVPQRFDFGDAPEKPYPVTIASGGAFHRIESGVHLGRRVDAEPDGQPSALANRDDQTPSPVVDDEDGVVFVSPLIPGTMATVEVVASAKGFLNAWIDFDQNGDWSGGAEKIFNAVGLSPGVNTLTFNVPSTAEPTLQGPTFSRWRFSTTDPVLGPTGGGVEDNRRVPDGEVEDYPTFIRQKDPEPLDFGDAPASYGTLWTDDGARHRIDPDLFLGERIDQEEDGAPSVKADGDDVLSTDDEDGVEFLTPLIPGREARLGVVASSTGRLDVWIDVDRNQRWTSSEQVIVSATLKPGENQLSYEVPAWALPGSEPTYVRARFSREGGLSPTGYAPDGEVEDYAVEIGERDPQGQFEPVVELGEATLNVLNGSTRFPEPTFIPVEDGGREWVQMLSQGSEALVGGPLGTPAVPVYRRLIAVPAGAKMSVKLTKEPVVAHSMTVPLIPFQETALDDEHEPPSGDFFDDPDTFEFDEEAYNSDGTFPEEVVKVTSLGKMRDVEVALLEIATGQYNPSTQVLDSFFDVFWEVEFSGGEGFLPEKAFNPFEHSKSQYEALLNGAILEDYVYPGEIVSRVGEELLILTHPDFREAADKLADWKEDKGIMTSVFEVGAGTVRDTKEEIKDLIQSRWDTTLTRASYVLFVGDTEFIPTYYRKSYYAGGNGGPRINGNQDFGHDQWRSLGTANFTGNSEYVELKRLERKNDITDPGATVADAVRFVNVETNAEYIVDNQDSGFSVVSGTWYESAATDEWDGSSLWTRDEEARVRFEAPSLPEGQYEVFARWSGRRSDGTYYDRDSDAQYTIVSANTGTDTPYTLVAGGFLNLLPDLANGRIPVDTAAQAMTVVDKIIDYEKTPPGSRLDDAFYANASFASQFQGYRNGSPTGRDNRAFIEESERARDTLMSAGKTVERIYTKTEDANQISEEPNRYYDGSLLPSDLRVGSGFAWDGNTSDVVDAFDEGRFLMVHRDHGWPGGWSHPGFSTTQVNGSIANGNLTPVVYSINCASGLFDNETSGSLTGSSPAGTYFSEALLRRDNGGAVGIIGDTRNSNTWSNTAFLRGLIDATWQNNDPGYGAGSISRLGDIMNYAKTYTVMQIGVSGSTPEVELQFGLDTINLYHVFGDPTMEMHTSNPHRFILDGGLAYERVDPSTLTFEYAVDGAEITAYQTIRGETVPLGRETSSDGGGKMSLIREADPDFEIQFSACMEGAVCRPLNFGLLGDFNGDGSLNTPDLNLLSAAFQDGLYVPEYDLTGDEKLNLEDRDLWLQLKGTRPGDLDLDLKVNFADFLMLSANFGKQEALWEMGDSNMNGVVDFGDFLLLSANYGFDGAAADEVFAEFV